MKNSTKQPLKKGLRIKKILLLKQLSNNKKNLKIGHLTMEPKIQSQIETKLKKFYKILTLPSSLEKNKLVKNLKNLILVEHRDKIQ